MLFSTLFEHTYSKLPVSYFQLTFPRKLLHNSETEACNTIVSLLLCNAPLYGSNGTGKIRIVFQVEIRGYTVPI